MRGWTAYRVPCPVPGVLGLTLMFTSSLKADFCSSKALLESAILVSAMNFTSSISFLHSASWSSKGGGEN